MHFFSYRKSLFVCKLKPIWLCKAVGRIDWTGGFHFDRKHSNGWL